MVGTLFPLLCGSNFWSGMDPVWFLEKFREHAVELSQNLLDLIYEYIWESASKSMKDGPLLFPVVPHKDIAFANHLEVGPFPFEFSISYVLGLCIRYNEDLGRSREVLDLFESKFVNFNRVIFQVQDNGVYPNGITELPNTIDFCIVLFS